MEKQTKFYQTIPGVALITLLILLIPFVAMQFTDEVNWGVGDFIIMGTLLFITGLTYALVTRYAPNMIYRAGVLGAVGTTFLMVWANLAVGLIGAGPNLGNLMYIGVVAVVLIGTFLSRFTPKGMELTMFASALALVLLTVIALFANMNEYLASSVTEIIGVNAFFAALYTVSGLLFRYVALQQSKEKSAG